MAVGLLRTVEVGRSVDAGGLLAVVVVAPVLLLMLLLALLLLPLLVQLLLQLARRELWQAVVVVGVEVF